MKADTGAAGAKWRFVRNSVIAVISINVRYRRKRSFRTLTRFSCFFAEKRNQPPQFLHLLRPQAVLVVGMRLATRCSTASAVQAADGPPLLRRALAAQSCRLGRGAASGGVSEALSRVHGVSVTFLPQPSPLSGVDRRHCGGTVENECKASP